MNAPSRVLIACDKFKGSLNAVEACQAIARALTKKWPDVEIDICPIADGGEGFMDAMAGAMPGQWVEAPAHDALGREIRARYWLADAAHGPIAVMEMAEASGFWRIAPHERDILHSNTFGTGEMMRHAVETHRVSHIVMGIGGSATNDGGAGMAAALGVQFLDASGSPLDPIPAALAGHLATCDTTHRIPLPPVTAACDVTNPLLGPRGATRVFGPQKGADAQTIPILESTLQTMVEACNGSLRHSQKWQGPTSGRSGEKTEIPEAIQKPESLASDNDTHPIMADCPAVKVQTASEAAESQGAGAAGGLGFGLLHFVNAELKSGFSLVADLTDLEKRVAAADWIITGEGSLDAQSLDGKGPLGVAMLARKYQKFTIAFCGIADASATNSGWFDHINSLSSTGLPKEELMQNASALLESLTTQSLKTLSA